MVEVIGVPVTHRNPYHPWMAKIHEWNVTKYDIEKTDEQELPDKS